MHQPLGRPSGRAFLVRGSSEEGKAAQSAQNCPGELFELLPEGCTL